MRMVMKYKNWILFGLITGLCLALVLTLYSMEPVQKVGLGEAIPLKRVTVQNVKPGAYPPRIKVYGEAVSRWTTTLHAQINGEITYINENLQPGQKLEAGEIILEIDKHVYLAAVAQARLDLETARVNFLQAERRADQAKSDWNRAGFKADPSSSLVFHGPQLTAAKARVESAQKNLEKALYELGHTKVKAPYTGLVVERFADKGETVFAGDTLVRMVSVDDVEIRINLDIAQAKRIGKWQEAGVKIKEGLTGQSWRGKIIRRGGILDKKTRLQCFYISPLEGKNEILPGLFVTAFIHGKKQENLLALPESSLTRDGYIWFADKEDKLRNIQAIIAFYENGKVFIENPEKIQQMRVVLTPIQSYISGTKVNPVVNKADKGEG